MVRSNDTRRSFLKATALGGIVLGTSGTAGAAASSTATDSSRFYVEGERITIVEYEPETITVEVRKRSPDLPERLESGSREVVETTEYDRTELEHDPWPDRDRDVDRERWETYVATEDEWRDAFDAATNGDLGFQHSHSRSEDQYDHAIWTYSDIDESGYERRNPINVVFDLSTQTFGDVQDVISDQGWSYLDWDAIPPEEYRRFAWNQDRDQFEDSHASLGYAWTTGDPNSLGINGRYHVQSWEFVDGVVGMHCHEDTPVPHSVASYESAEAEIHSIFDSEPGWEAIADETALPNALDDHDGSATRIED